MTRLLLVLLLGLSPMCTAASAAQVVQGRCLGIDPLRQQIQLEEYGLRFSELYPYGCPTGRVMLICTARARFDEPLITGDVLRIAYEMDEQGNYFAVRIMNVSRKSSWRE